MDFITFYYYRIITEANLQKLNWHLVFKNQHVQASHAPAPSVLKELYPNTTSFVRSTIDHVFIFLVSSNCQCQPLPLQEHFFELHYVDLAFEPFPFAWQQQWNSKPEKNCLSCVHPWPWHASRCFGMAQDWLCSTQPGHFRGSFGVLRWAMCAFERP